MQKTFMLIATGIFAGSMLIAPSAIAEDFWLKVDDSGCEMWSDEPAQDDDLIMWSGECDGNNKTTGEGLAIWLRGEEVYSRYTGRMRAGRLHDKSGLLFIKSSEAKGFDVVSGSFKNGALHGEVTILSANGVLFKGNYVEDLRHGTGLIVDSKGNSFQGNFANGSAKGIGESYSPTGEAYIGEFSNNVRNGLGVLYKDDGQIYIGEFENDAASGAGRLEGPDGYFQGQFSDNAPNGPGVLVKNGGPATLGQFVNGKLEGTIVVTQPNGEQKTENWENGEKVQ